MSRWHNLYLDNHAHFCTATVVDWRPLLYDKAAGILYEEWAAARVALSTKLLAYVIMPEHFHIILWAVQGQSVSAFLRRTLSLAARRIRPGGALWKERPRVLPIYSESVLETKLRYLHRNPVRRGLVSNPEEWAHSSFGQIEMNETGLFVCDGWGNL
jgi:putative transposase